MSIPREAAKAIYWRAIDPSPRAAAARIRRAAHSKAG